MTETPSSRVVITVLGKNRPGIVAGVTSILSEANVDIRDITQSIIEDIFTMTRGRFQRDARFHAAPGGACFRR